MRPNGGRGRGRGWELERSASELAEELAEEEERSKIHERHLRGTFGEESIINLGNMLYEETSPSQEEKSMFFFSWPTNAFIVDMKNPNSTDTRAVELPSELKNLSSFGCTVLKTQIIIAGGEGKNEEGPSDKVFVFDTVSKTWAPPSRMKRTRGIKPTVVAADSKLFVFGGNPSINLLEEYKNLDDSDMTHLDDYDTTHLEDYYHNPRRTATKKKLWAEFCCNTDDATTSWSWDYLPPSHRFPCGQWETPYFCTHAIYPRKNLILFHDDSCKSVWSFDYKTGKWEKFKDYMPINFYFHWSESVVILEDLLFWHFHGTIYAHDLLDSATYPVYNLPHPNLFGTCLGCTPDMPTFLVRANKNTLWLFCSVRKNSVWYWTFLVDITADRGPGILALTLVQQGILNTPIPVNVITHALECST